MKLFDYDGPIMSLLRKLWAILCSGLLFLAACIPVFTAGASFTALYDVTERNLKNDRGYVAGGFIESLRKNWKQTLPAGAVIAAVLIVFELDINVMKAFLEDGRAIGNMYILFRIMQALLLIYSVWVFAQIACYENSMKQILKNSLVFSIRHLGVSICIGLLLIAGGVVIWILPISVVIVPVLITWFMTALLDPVFKRYSGEGRDH